MQSNSGIWLPLFRIVKGFCCIRHLIPDALAYRLPQSMGAGDACVDGLSGRVLTCLQLACLWDCVRKCRSEREFRCQPKPSHHRFASNTHLSH